MLDRLTSVKIAVSAPASGSDTASATSDIIDMREAAREEAGPEFARVSFHPSDDVTGTILIYVQTSDTLTGSGDSVALSSPETIKIISKTGAEKYHKFVETFVLKHKRYIQFNVTSTGAVTLEGGIEFGAGNE